MAGRQIIDKPSFLTSRERKLIFSMTKWIEHGACQKMPDPGFLAERTNNPRKNAEQEARAKGICSTCPVRIECLDHALRMPERGGIWGGLNDIERDILIRRLRKQNPEQWASIYDEH